MNENKKTFANKIKFYKLNIHILFYQQNSPIFHSIINTDD